jgi:hypothetical protein
MFPLVKSEVIPYMLPYQRNCIALARGVIVKEKTMNYVGEVRELGPRPSTREPLSVIVQAPHAHDAAQEVARLVARQWWVGGEPSFIAQQPGANNFIAGVGVQEWCESGIVTRGCSIAITVHPRN